MNKEALSPEQQKEITRLNLWLSSADHTLENYKKLPGTENSFKVVRNLAEGKAHYFMVLIYGGVGNGKTYLCEATSLCLFSRGIICRVLSWPQTIRALKRAMEPDSGTSPEKLIEKYCTTKHLIVDDVGAGMSGSDYGMKEIEEIVSARYHDHLFTLMTTNKDISQLPDRVVSRFRDTQYSRLVLNKGEDYRLRK
jgi:DNA replication protein DnaC